MTLTGTLSAGAGIRAAGQAGTESEEEAPG